MIQEASALRLAAEPAADKALASLPPDDPLAALLADVRGFVAFNFERAATLEQMSGVFQTTKAGLQHATHIYEGEGKYLGVHLAALLDKHRAVLALPAAQPMVATFVSASRAIEQKYANRIVGF